MNDPGADLEQSICAALRGAPVVGPVSNAHEHARRLHECAAYHGVGPLLSRCFRDAPPAGLPTAQALKGEAAIELIRKREIVQVLDALAESGVEPLLLKGTALAHWLYPSPVLRPRADTDILIRDGDRKITDGVLSDLGYERPNAISGDLVTYQCGYLKRDHLQIEHVLDVHWRISNTQLFSAALGHAELMSRSLPLPALGAHARMPAPGDALLLACMHRVHHFHSPYRVEGVPGRGVDRLIWLYDIHLLLEAMSPAALDGFLRSAEHKGLRAICADGIQTARRCFGTRVPSGTLERLQRAGPREACAAHLRSGRIRHLLIELQSLESWRKRWGLIREHLLPPADYMLARYATGNRAWLPMLYVRRGILGAWKRMLSA